MVNNCSIIKSSLAGYSTQWSYNISFYTFVEPLVFWSTYNASFEKVWHKTLHFSGWYPRKSIGNGKPKSPSVLWSAPRLSSRTETFLCAAIYMLTPGPKKSAAWKILSIVMQTTYTHRHVYLLQRQIEVVPLHSGWPLTFPNLTLENFFIFLLQTSSALFHITCVLTLLASS